MNLIILEHTHIGDMYCLIIFGLIQTPQFELGNDTTLTLCENDSVVLDPGGGFTGYLWQDGTPTQTYTVDTTGLYWVQCFNEYGCSWTDSVFVTIEEYIEYGIGND